MSLGPLLVLVAVVLGGTKHTKHSQVVCSQALFLQGRAFRSPVVCTVLPSPQPFTGHHAQRRCTEDAKQKNQHKPLLGNWRVLAESRNLEFAKSVTRCLLYEETW